MHIFYTPDIASNNYTLNQEESKHCSKVLRLIAGDIVYLIDGRGGFYKAEITETGKKQVKLSVISKQEEYNKRNHYLHIAVAPTKNIERIEWFLEKATEVGIDEITLIICERSERKAVNKDRLKKIIISAIKQSVCAYHPKINDLVCFKHFIKQLKDNPVSKFIAHCQQGEKLSLSKQIMPHHSYLILIGPEGDFSPSEINIALKAGYKPVTLGNTRLRTETAALAACFEINYINK